MPINPRSRVGARDVAGALGDACDKRNAESAAISLRTLRYLQISSHRKFKLNPKTLTGSPNAVRSEGSTSCRS